MNRRLNVIAAPGQLRRWATFRDLWRSSHEHSVVYLGYFPRAFAAQRPGVLEHMAKDGTLRVADVPELDGVLFGCMEDLDPNGGKRFLAVRALYNDTDVPVGNAVAFDRERHTDGKGFGPRPPTFGDTSAENLLSDMVEINHAVAQQLREIATQAGLTLSL